MVLGTGGTEGAALELASIYHREYRKAQQALAGELPHEPLGRAPAGAMPPMVLVAHPYSNSLPSALETLARMQQDGLRGRVVYLASAAAGNPQGEEGWATLAASLQVRRVEWGGIVLGVWVRWASGMDELPWVLRRLMVGVEVKGR